MGQTEKSAVAEHALSKENHKILFGEVKLLAIGRDITADWYEKQLKYTNTATISIKRCHRRASTKECWKHKKFGGLYQTYIWKILSIDILRLVLNYISSHHNGYIFFSYPPSFIGERMHPITPLVKPFNGLEKW